MELLSVSKAQSLWLFDLNDLNPRGKFLISDLIGWLEEKYEFSQVPKDVKDVDETKGLAFKQGAYRLGSDPVTIEVTIYNDGIIGNSYSSTEATDMFLQDVLTSVAKEFRLSYEPKIIRSKTYQSELVIRMDQSLAKINPKVAAFADAVSQTANRNLRFEFGEVGFWADNFGNVLKPTPFSIERRIGAPFSENRYYSKAPVGTSTHLDLLSRFENLLSEM